MKNLYRVLRALLVTVIVVPLIMPVILYVALSFDGVRRHIASVASRELTALLGADVVIEGVDFALFNRIVLRNVTVSDSLDRKALSVGHLGAGISISESLWQQRPVITYGELIDVDVRLMRDSVGSPLNIEPILAKFRKKERTETKAFNLSVNMVVVRRSRFSYDILSEPRGDSGRFDPSHISVSDIRADIRAPQISDSIIEIDLKRMGAFERSGITLSDITANISVDRESALIENLTIELPASRLALDNIELSSPLSPLPSPDSISTRLATLSNSYISTRDLYPLLPENMKITEVIDVELEAEGSPDNFAIERFSLYLRDSETHLSTKGTVAGATRGIEGLSVNLPRLSLNVSAPSAVKIISPYINGDEALATLANLGRVDLLASLRASESEVALDGSIVTDCGDIDVDASLTRSKDKSQINLNGIVNLISFNPSGLHKSLQDLTDISIFLRGDITIGGDKSILGSAEAIMERAVWKGERYDHFAAEATFAPGHVDFRADSGSPQFNFALSGGHDLGSETPSTEVFAHIRNLDLSKIKEQGKFSGYSVSATIDGAITGLKPDDINGWLNISDLTFKSLKDGRINAGDIAVEVSALDSIHTLKLASRPMSLDLEGRFSYPALITDLKSMAASVFPALVNGDVVADNSSTASLAIDIKPDSVYSKLFNLPVGIIQPVKLNVAKEGGILNMNLDAPYLLKKDKLIEQTAIKLNLNTPDGDLTLLASTLFPTKDGLLDINLLTSGSNDSTDTRINWVIDREKDFHGELLISTAFAKDENGGNLTTISMKPSELVFNDSAWQVNKSEIKISPQLITINNVGGQRNGQSLVINGQASPDSLSRVTIDLDHIDLDYLFETLAISDAVMFGGIATGSLYGEALISKSPVLYTPKLHVDGIAYNNCVMGDADVVSWWDNKTQKVSIKADIKGDEGWSKINGYIRPASEELVFNFNADRAPVGFMLPFMSAFTSQISGHVSGDALLYGTFKDLDVKGKVFVDSLNMKLDFTNTSYTVTDTVRLDPGRISFSDVTLKDRYGHTAKLAGVVTHRYFHEPTFSFDITDARDLLVYDVGENDTADPWYGSIFGRGNAEVRGVPGRIDIGVNMTTEPKSTFTFVLSDSEQSVDYDFITFHDRDKARKDSIAALDPTPQIIKKIKANANKRVEGPPSQYILDFNVDITPQATLNLIMDPIGGDKIVAQGSGHLGMKYDSQGELEIRGDYTLNQGSYSFTLQDIILKDFTIREGSKIRFSGDPYAAQLDITAAYTTKANLTDLDESFLQDPELNRTNVNVNAIMHVRGDMRSPDISYDLEFPSLTSDIDRKVKSIISTEEMMSQQIIYLLALNRFYTPDYMSATRGNELVSVASSTLSSRLGSMLGALSDTWSIAPSINSSKGDFSDVEVDVALSSQLLDNRLLFNGNLGYRDKSLNNNSFIGDFDIRYLLNRRGTIQLKAYNRYNDQNYYLKSALTTQGVGIVFKRDFDNIFSFLRPLKHKKETSPADSVSEK